MAVSRTSTSLKNSQVALLYYLFNLLLGFISRKVFIDHLGIEVLGLNSTAGNILELLNLAELGIGMAIGVTLYKPLFNNDHETINEIVALQGWLYRRIAYVVGAAAIVLMCFFPWIFGKIDLPLWYAYASFGVLLISALLTYFANYRQVLLSANQKEYMVTLSYKGSMLIKRLVQIFAVIYFEHGYVWWLVIELIFAFLASWVLNLVIRREFPYLHKIDHPERLYEKYPDVVLKIKQIFIHKVGTAVLTQMSPLIIYTYATLTLVALYGNYMLVIWSTIALLGALFSNMDAAVGHLVSQGDKKQIMRVFNELFSIRFFVAATACFAIYWLMPLFVEIWLGKEYIMDNLTLALMTAIMYILLTRMIIDSFKNAFGLFQDVWAPALEAGLNLGLSLLFGYFWGLHGILVGVLISLLVVVFIWKPYFVFRDGFKETLWIYIRMYGKHLFAAVASVLFVVCIASFVNIDLQSNIWHFIAHAVVYVGLYAAMLFFLLLLSTKGMKDFVSRIRTELIMKR